MKLSEVRRMVSGVEVLPAGPLPKEAWDRVEIVRCPNCGDDCWHLPGYPWCRPCGEHHRPPECAVDEQGRSLMSCGCAWSVVEAAGHGEEAHYAAGCYLVRDRA